jgi:hypothetical protein
MAWRMAASRGHVKFLENLWDGAKELQLKPEDLNIRCGCQKTSQGKWFETSQEWASLNY